MSTIIEQLAAFSTGTRFEDLPAAVVDEVKRLVLDSIGCAFAAVEHPKGRIGIEYGRLVAGQGNAAIMGTPHRASVLGAAIANGELINALDMDAVVPPGHVTPYVLPGALAVGETSDASGRDLICAVAVAHEMSWRFGKAMDYLRDMKNGQLDTPKVFGFSSTIFGATAAIGMLQRQSADVLADSLSIAGYISPVQSMMAFFHHSPSTTIKYTMASALVQSAMMAAHMGLLRHRGDVQLLDDAEHGYARFIGTQRWAPERITTDLGKTWGFVSEQLYKLYPHCRILHGPLDCLTEIVEKNDIRPEEIESIDLLVEGFVEKPTWLTQDIQHVHDGQFSIAHGMAIGAHRLPLGRDWQDPRHVFSPSVLGLMKKVRHRVHPDYVKALSSHASARPSRVEVRARGQTFVAERLYPRGSPSPDPGNLLSTEELIAKFHRNAEGVVSHSTAEAIVHAVMDLDRECDVAMLMALTTHIPA
ncbi:MmgE/PrpD family protein [Pseudorhodoferax sp.]|uniref:MmgE/PrpD family protein n=1 Tax=Pseudorhodoferax sp. TaxID=1993553 RepID=UPI0039E43401